MKLKFVFLILIATIFTMSAGAQSKEQVEKAHKDPKTTEMAAKADVYIASTKKIFDSAKVKLTTPMIAEIPDKKKKKGTCRKS